MNPSRFQTNLTLITFVLGLILISQVVFALQPAGFVSITSSSFTSYPANESAILLNDTNWDVTSANWMDYILTSNSDGSLTIKANITFKLQSALIPIANTGVNITFDFPGSYSSDNVVANVFSDTGTCSLGSYSSDNTTINIACILPVGSNIANINVTLVWNITIPVNSSVIQTTTQPLLAFDITNSTSVDYVQNFTLKAPFPNNVTINVTLPDENVTIVSIQGNATPATKSAQYL
jgi:hypothetical protein